MKLLVELADEQDVEILTEDTASEGKRRFITGKWAAVDEEVKNGRTYPFAVMEGALNTYHKNKISQKMANKSTYRGTAIPIGFRTKKEFQHEYLWCRVFNNVSSLGR